MGDSPILYIRVKKANMVKMRGAIKNSYSSRVCRIEVSGLIDVVSMTERV